VIRVFIIGILSVYLLSTTHLSELLKLPALVSHFDEHKSDQRDMTLWEFFCLHYGRGNVMDDDHEKDMKLPFKSQSVVSSVLSICSPFPEFLVSRSDVMIMSESDFSLYESVYSSRFLANIWHPPKSA